MKTAIYIEDGLVQLVLTPENEFEKNCFSAFKPEGQTTDPSAPNPISAQIFEGTFYDCRGGWVRQSAYQSDSMYGAAKNDVSLIIRTKAKSAELLIKD